MRGQYLRLDREPLESVDCYGTEGDVLDLADFLAQEPYVGACENAGSVVNGDVEGFRISVQRTDERTRGWTSRRQ